MFAFALLALLVSCDDAINIKQPGEINDPNAVYTTVKDLQRGLNGVYAVFSTESTIEFTSIFTDEVAIGINNGGQGLNDGLYNFQLNAGSDIASSIWGSNYTLINFANRILDAAKKVTPVEGVTGETQADYDAILWQLYTIRAYAHFQLLSYYSEDLKDDSKLGVMILDFVPNEDYDTFLPRSTNAECFAFIESDLAKADDLTAPGITNTLVNPDVTLALRARMAAYRGHYQDALTYSTEIASYYPLVTTVDDFDAMWGDTASSEVIFKLPRVNGDFEIGSYFASASSDINGSPFFEVGRALFNLYDFDNDIRSAGLSLIDPTSTVSIDPDSDPAYYTSDVLVINKYPGNPAQSLALINDIKVFRGAEMVLLKAEAYAGLNNLSGVATTIRGLRTARRVSGTAPLPSYANATEAWADILLERRKELAFEGFRYLDIKRLGVLAGNKGIERYSRDCEKYGSCTLAPTDHRFTMPIPTTEMSANPNIRSQQNTGY